VKTCVELICAPKGIAPEAGHHFPCKAVTSGGAAIGGHGCRSWTPQLSTSRLCPELGAEAMSPLWKYFSRREKNALELMCAPKGHGPRPLRYFPCKPAVFKVPLEGAMIAVADPRQAAVMWAKARAKAFSGLCTRALLFASRLALLRLRCRPFDPP